MTERCEICKYYDGNEECLFNPPHPQISSEQRKVKSFVKKYSICGQFYPNINMIKTESEIRNMQADAETKLALFQERIIDDGEFTTYIKNVIGGDFVRYKVTKIEEQEI